MFDGRGEIIRFLLRAGIAFAFIYPAVASFLDPLSWVGFFPSFIRNIFPGDGILLLFIFGAVEIIIALWILMGKNVFVPSMLAAITLAGIVLFNLPLLDIVFRDISLFLMALALALIERERDRGKSMGTL